jgi:amino acid adenylation domain-containing protein
VNLLVPQLVSETATSQRTALALSGSGQQFTYGELESRSNQLAHHLRSLGVKTESIVGICLDRGPSLVIAQLAVSKAGGAYLPLDAEFPIDRLRFMLEDSKAGVLITQSMMAEKIGDAEWSTVNLDLDNRKIASYPETLAETEISPESLAYVIYTSGSTGRPKGVQITHANLLNLVNWHTRTFSLTAADRASQMASVAFDAAVWDIWPNLATGSSIHFADDAIRVSAESMRDWMVEQQITIGFVPTPLAEAMIQLEWPKNTGLRFLLTGGDALHQYPPAGLPFALVNNYGPTECTVVATSGVIEPKANPDGPPSIGRPIDGFHAYVLDENAKQVPVGSLGELYLGGAGVGRGYLNLPEMNAERFVQNPWSKDANSRLYRTGDLVRLSPDGQFAFMGRADDQIKIRGYRIEPDEISAVLNRHPAVQASVVVARGEDSEKRLLAYVTLFSNTVVTHSELQQFLQQSVPDYMVPSAFVRVDAFPLKHSGKIDRNELPVADPDNTIGDQVYVAPRNPVEKRVAEILAELLGVGQVSVHDNFFFLGGHSLLGTQLIARVRDSFGVELPLRTVFDSPTAAEISAVIEQMLRKESMTAD